MTEPAAESLPTNGKRWTRWPKRIAAALLGIVVGLGVAEMVFRYRDDGAFPHLNTYVEDPELGVRLQPGATEKISFGGNPVTSVRINAQGYRGDDWPDAGKDDVLVVGDSQVFGLGVENDETFSSVMAGTLHRTVLNGGVPTYGPAEYAAVVEEQLAARHPRTVVLTLNMVNDLFEVSHPNKDRHRVWDGWAVRKETAPDGVTSFPGRHWLYSQSHLVFAFRKWWASGDPVDVQVQSEGTYSDLVAAGESVAKQRAKLADETASGSTKRIAAQSHLEHDKREIESAMYRAMNESDPDGEYQNYQLMQVTAQHAQPGDIVGNEFAEGARPIEVTAEMIERGERLRARLKKQLADKAKKGDAALAAVMTDHDNTLAHLSDLEASQLAAALEPPLLPYVRDVKALVEKDGARLVVVILPIDVQVSDDEWAKYGVDKRDMSRARLLSAELAASIERLGVSALDAQDVLKTVEPGAFLDHDIHMTPKGHAAVAGALAAKIEAKPPALPVVSTRPAVPMPASWDAVNEIVVAGSSAAGCETKIVRDWLRVMCERKKGKSDGGDFFQYGSIPLATIVSDETGEALATNLPGTATFLVPLVPGKAFTGHLRWDETSRDLLLTWTDGKPKVALGKVTKEKQAVYRDNFRNADERALCECWAHEFEENYGTSPSEIQDERCWKGYGAVDHGCTTKYYDRKDLDHSCPRVIACAWRDPGSPSH